MAQTAAHLADRPEAVTALTRIFLNEIRRLLVVAVAACGPQGGPQPRTTALGAVAFLHRFGSAFNRHVHLHACVTDDVFTGTPSGVVLPPAEPVTAADLAAITERVRRRGVGWLCRRGWLDGETATDMLAWERSGYSVDASVRIALVDQDVPSYSNSLEHLLRNPGKRGDAASERESSLPRGEGQGERATDAPPRSHDTEPTGSGLRKCR